MRDCEMRKNGRMIFLHLLWMSIAIMMVILVNCLGIWFSGGVVISFGINLLILIAQLIYLNIVGRNEDDNRDI